MVIEVCADVMLSSLEEADAEACVDLLQEPEVHVGLLQMPNPYHREDYERWFALVQEDTRQLGQPIQFAIRELSGQLLGGCGANEMIPGHKCEIGYWLGKPYWGQGIMTAVVEKLCDYLHRDFQLVRITASVFDGNTASMRVLEKNGFAHEGRMPKYYRKQGRYIDGERFAKVW
ncbi:GNAT family N-acetyltransferase [Blastopirellula marina]|nr:GNAT family protein [Blastopirellula marina]